MTTSWRLTTNGGDNDSAIPVGTSSELIMNGPGKCTLTASVDLPGEDAFRWSIGRSLLVDVQIAVVDEPTHVSLSLEAKPSADDSGPPTWTVR